MTLSNEPGITGNKALPLAAPEVDAGSEGRTGGKNSEREGEDGSHARNRKRVFFGVFFLLVLVSVHAHNLQR